MKYLVLLLLALSLTATFVHGIKGKAEQIAEVRAARIAEAAE